MFLAVGATLFESISTIVAQLFTIVTTVITTVVSNPILLIGLSLGFVCGAIKIFKKIRR